MQNTAAGKFNIIPGISVPLMFFKNGFTLATAFLGGLFSTFSGKQQKDGSLSTCTRRKHTMASELGLSDSSVWRGMNVLKANGLSVVEEKPDTYIFDHAVTQDGQFVRVPYKLLTEEFDIVHKERKDCPAWTERRFLTNSEAAVGGLIITYCDNVKKHKKEFETSNSEIAETLGLSEPTVQAALDTLIGAHIIYCKDKGVNRYQKSKYHVHRKFLRKKKRQANKAKTAAPLTGNEKVIVYKTAEEVKAEQRANFERDYYNKKHLAEDTAERNYERAMKDNAFKEAELEMKAMACDLGFAEALNSPELPELRKRYEKYKRQRDDALKRLKMSDEDFDPEAIMSRAGN